MVAVDAMGGDYAPCVVVEGSVFAARKGIHVGLFGDKTRIVTLLNQIEHSWKKLPISLFHCSQAIQMTDEPGRSIIRKKDSSLVRATQAVAQGEAHAIISAGNSGAALVAGMLFLGKIPGILRPAIGSFLPTRSDSVFCLDLGANVDCKPEYLRQFAIMGDAYVRLTKKLEHPKIALLTNGTEPGKGTKLIQEAYELLSTSPLKFIGNCEPTDIFNDVADVIVCEGFSGNIMLKAMEATVQVVTQWLKDEGNRSIIGRCAGLLGAPVFRRLKKNIKKAQRGGALLLGLEKPLIIAHGSSNAQAIEDAIVFAQQIINEQFNVQFKELVIQSLQKGIPIKSYSPALEHN